MFEVCVLTVTAEELWRGVLAESGAGARKGRGKRTKRKLRRDLNRGQIIGEGKTLTFFVLFLFVIVEFEIKLFILLYQFKVRKYHNSKFEHSC